MTREELIKRLSYRDQFNKPIVDNVGLGALLDEVIAMLKDDRPKGRWAHIWEYCPWCGGRIDRTDEPYPMGRKEENNGNQTED